MFYAGKCFLVYFPVPEELTNLANVWNTILLLTLKKSFHLKRFNKYFAELVSSRKITVDIHHVVDNNFTHFPSFTLKNITEPLVY